MEGGPEISDREIYPNAPLQFVAFELRTPLTPRLAQLEGTAAVYEELKELVPIIHAPQGPAGFEVMNQQPGLVVSHGPTRMMNRSRTLSVVVSPNVLIVETSDYVRFESFLDVIRGAVNAIGHAAPIAGIQRVGLRYIDEIRVESVKHPADWEPYIKPALLAAMKISSDVAPLRTECLVEFEISDSQRTVMRFGAMTGRVVDPTGPLRLKRSGEGPFFLIDLDSFWTPHNDVVPPFSPDDVVEICSGLRGPIRHLFESSITDRLRDDVFRKGGEDQ